MEKRDLAILLLALVVVVVIAVVVKPILTGKSPDLSLPPIPFSSKEQESLPPTQLEITHPTTPAGTPTPTPVPTHTWDGSTMDLWYVVAGAVSPTAPDEARANSGTALVGTTATTPIPGVLIASFSATPLEGPVPLPVQFTDTSTGVPDRWTWSFGDGTTSSQKNPFHTYTDEGSYQVSLTVENALGGNTRIHQGYITVTAAGEKDVVIQAKRGGVVAPGGFIEFTITKPGSRIKIGGLVVDLPVGTRVRLVVGNQGKGKIAIQGRSIQEYSFEQVVLSINGIYTQSGVVQEIRVQEYDGLISSLVLDVAGGDGDIGILENGVPIENTAGQSPLTLVSIRPDSSGLMILDCYWPDVTSFQGAVTSYNFS